MKKIKIAECDIFFLSYDEPNADENFEQLQKHVPWVKRVHGIEGSDAAHKACANNSETDRLVIIDADNFLIKSRFLNQVIEIDESVPNIENSVISWPSLNIINGLVYGNGGIKCWNKSTILNMKTHESAKKDDLRSQVEFCWNIPYLGVDAVFSEIRNNSTPFQAWRAGFREGVKLGLDQGTKVQDLNNLWKENLNRLLVWCNIGADVPNGIWAILGARQGCYMTNFTDWDYINVRDFRWLNLHWQNYVKLLSIEQVHKEVSILGQQIGKILPIDSAFTPQQSKFFKRFLINPLRQKQTIKIRDLNDTMD